MSTSDPTARPTEPTTSYEQARDELAEVVHRLEAGGLTLEESLALWERGEELAGVVERLETGGTSLEESLALWERGEQLAVVCQQWLDGARQRLQAAIDDRRGPDGAAVQPAEE